MRIVFMGTPEFSVPALNELINCRRNELVAVYTRKPKKADRGQKIQESPVYRIAKENGINIYTPSSFRNSHKNQEEFKNLKPDLVVVVAYGLIIPEEILNVPTYGFINIHPSLLPRWRGSAPMQRCLLSEDKETGVCIMKLDTGMDTGDILKVSDKIIIDKNVDLEYLHDNLSVIGAKMLTDVINDIEKNNGIVNTVKQDNSLATIANKIDSSEGKIDFQNSSVFFIERQIRALGKFIGTYFIHNKKRIKILKANILDSQILGKIGTILNDKFFIQCKDGILEPLILQKEGKKPMDISNFLNGYRFNVGDNVE